MLFFVLHTFDLLQGVIFLHDRAICILFGQAGARTTLRFNFFGETCAISKFARRRLGAFWLEAPLVDCVELELVRIGHEDLGVFLLFLFAVNFISARISFVPFSRIGPITAHICYVRKVVLSNLTISSQSRFWYRGLIFSTRLAQCVRIHRCLHV